MRHGLQMSYEDTLINRLNREHHSVFVCVRVCVVQEINQDKKTLLNCICEKCKMRI